MFYSLVFLCTCFPMFSLFFCFPMFSPCFSMFYLVFLCFPVSTLFFYVNPCFPMFPLFSYVFLCFLLISYLLPFFLCLLMFRLFLYLSDFVKTWPLGFRLAQGKARLQATAVSKNVGGLPSWLVQLDSPGTSLTVGWSGSVLGGKTGGVGRR